MSVLGQLAIGKTRARERAPQRRTIVDDLVSLATAGDKAE
jgi:hypothetical protein